MENLTVEQAREFLESQGYYVKNLWHINDVKDRFECTDEEAQEVLDTALQNEWIVEKICLTIKDEAKEKGLTQKEKEL